MYTQFNNYKIYLYITINKCGYADRQTYPRSAGRSGVVAIL